jgi:O-acetyl-ADP-ribose deacetylase (regulator of RNase III)
MCNPLKILLYSLRTELSRAWKKELGEKAYVEIIEGDLLDTPADAIVSPANSFGFMDGGLDYKISERFGWNIQDRLQRIIKEKHHGELLVGMAEIVETGNEVVRFVISAPTMRVPKSAKGSINAYLSTRAALLRINEHNQPDEPNIRSVASPGMGTGVGEIPCDLASLQMRVAIEQVIEGKIRFPEDFAEAQIIERCMSIPGYRERREPRLE